MTEPRERQHAARESKVSCWDVTSAYLESRADTSPQHAKALRAAMPTDVGAHTAHWLQSGTRRGERASGLGAAEVASVLADVLRWCHQEGIVSQHEAAISMAQLELIRRREGAEPKPIALPPPQRPGELTMAGLRTLLVHSECMSYHGALAKHDDDEQAFTLLAAGTTEISLHLAEADGVPIRPSHLDPIAFAREVAAPRPSDELGPRPLGYVSRALDGAAMFYDRCQERGVVSDAVASQLSTQLRSLAVTHRQGERAA